MNVQEGRTISLAEVSAEILGGISPFKKVGERTIPGKPWLKAFSATFKATFACTLLR
jgi:hypothetical protein